MIQPPPQQLSPELAAELAPFLAERGIALSYARCYVAFGWVLCLLESHRKKLEWRGGYAERAICTPEQVEKAFRGVLPHALGLVLDRSHTVAVDVDPRNDGYTSYLELERRLGPPPQTVMQLTPQGGFHLLFQAPSTRLRYLPARGVEIKQRGHVVLAPTLFGGRRYLFAEGHAPWQIAPAELPAAWSEELAAPAYTRGGDASVAGAGGLVAGPAATVGGLPATSRARRYCEHAVDGELARLKDAHPGERHRQLFMSASRLAELAECAAGGTAPGQVLPDENWLTAAIGRLVDRGVELGIDTRGELERIAELGAEGGIVCPRFPKQLPTGPITLVQR